MFYMIIITIGLFEFILGCTIAIFSKSKKICKYTSLIYSEERGTNEEFLSEINEINKWIGQNNALGGSLYAFLGATARYYDINILILILLIILVEYYTYRRVTKGIDYIIGNSKKQA